MRERRLHPGHAERHRHRRPSRRRGGRGRARCARAGCASPASRCCATSRGSRATCTRTRWTSPRRCSRCAARSARACCWSARRRRAHATGDLDALVRDLRKLAMLAVPLGIRIAYEALSWGRHVNEFTAGLGHRAGAPTAPNLGLGLDSFHILAHKTAARRARRDRPAQGVPGAAVRLHVAGDAHAARSASRPRATSACFPARACTAQQLAELVRRARRDGLPRRLQLRGVQRRLRQLPLPMVAERARRSVKWITGRSSRRSLPARGAAQR